MRCPPLELVAVEFSEWERSPDDEVRGVFQDEESFGGVIAFRVVDSHGHLRYKAEMPAADAVGEVERLEAWLDRHDPIARLRAI